MTGRMHRWKWSGLGAALVAAASTLALAAPAVSVAAGPAAPTPWEQYHGGPAHTGYQPHETTLTPSTVPRLGIAWQKTLGYIGGSSPAVVGDTVYVGAGTSLYALATAGGAVRWSQQLIGNAYANSPAVVAGTAYMTSATFDDEPAYAWAFDAATGARKWRTAFPTDRSHFVSSPTVAGGLVYLLVTGFCVSAPCGPNTVFALDSATGSRRWSARVGIVEGQLAVRDGVLYYGDDNGNVVALDARTGAPRWRSSVNTATESNEVGSPAVANGLVYVGVHSFSSTDTGRVLCALDANTGAQRWCLSARSRGGQIPTVGNGLVYAVTESQLYAVNAVTGAMRWRRGIAGIVDAPALAAGVLYAGVTPFRGLRQVYALDAATGETLKTVPLGPFSQGNVYSSPAVYRGSVYVGYTEGYLTALRLR